MYRETDSMKHTEDRVVPVLSVCGQFGHGGDQAALLSGVFDIHVRVVVPGCVHGEYDCSYGGILDENPNKCPWNLFELCRRNPQWPCECVTLLQYGVLRSD